MAVEYSLSKKLMAEFIAMVLFVWVGCGTAVSSQSIDVLRGTTDGTSASFLIATALAFGIGISVLVYTIAPVSGGHINPAVTVSLCLLGEIDAFESILYILVQCIGAFLGAGIVWGSMNNSIVRDLQDEQNEDSGADPPFLLGVNIVDSATPVGSAFLLELMGTFLLVWTVCMTAVSSKSIAGNTAPIAIGWSVLLAHLCLIPFTGCGINPARSLGPMLVLVIAGEKINNEGWWIYYVAPFVGGAFAAVIYKFIFVLDDTNNEKDEPEAPAEKKLDDTTPPVGASATVGASFTSD